MIDPNAPDFTDTPASSRRPTSWYAPAEVADPLVSIITPYYNVGPVFAETVLAVQRMSLVRWEWLVVDDGSTDPKSVAQLAAVAAGEPRMRVLRQPNGGPGVARNFAATQARGTYLMQLDGDDVVEPTFLEKSLWLLETQPQFAAANGFTVTFGANNFLWLHGFHNYEVNVYENMVTNMAVIRRDAWVKAGGYDEAISYEHADWDFWMNLAQVGMWGYTIEEFLTWYRTQQHSLLREIENDGVRAKRFRDRHHAKHRNLRRHFPKVTWARDAEDKALDLRETPPFTNALAKPAGVRRVLCLFPWLEMGGADKFNLDVIRTLSARGYEFTVATTALSSDPWLHQVSMLTPDVFCLHRFLDVADYLRFILYLIESRGIDAVMISNSELAYALVPYLRARFPHLALLDYCHSEDPRWLNGGYPALSLAAQAHLDAQVTCTDYLRQWMIARGGEASAIQVQHCNIDTVAWAPDLAQREATRATLGIPASQPVIVFTGRLASEKRPQLFAEIIRRVAKQEPNFMALMIGGGPEERSLRQLVEQHGLSKWIRLLGPQPHAEVRSLLNAADIVLLPSTVEGLALVLYEAMAVQTVPVAARIGGQAELVTEDVGYLIAPGPNDVDEYVAAILALLREPARREALAARGRQRVADGFDLTHLASGMDTLFRAAITHASERAAVVDEATLAQVREQTHAALQTYRHPIATQRQVWGQGKPSLAMAARRLRQRFFPMGSASYERYKRVRHAVTVPLHWLRNTPR